MPTALTATSVDEYIALQPRKVQPILKKIRAILRKALPDAEEKISYRMPTFTQSGALIYFAAFKSHIGLYPPVRGDSGLLKETARYRGEKGNLKFPLDEPMQYALIARVAKARLREHLARLAAKKSAKKRSGKKK